MDLAIALQFMPPILLWEQYFECAAFSETAAHGDLALVKLGNTLGDAEPEPGAAGISRTGFVCAVEAVEYSLLLLLRYAHSGVGHLHLDMVAERCRFQGDTAAGLGALDGIVE